MSLSLNLLHKHFGFTQFREGQQQVIDTILNGESAAAIFPTGSGKSLCYQLPAIELPNLTLVISPLLALMQDQLEFLSNKGIASASIDSMQTREQVQQVMQLTRNGQIKVLMVSVERLNNERFRQFLQQIPISLLVVDEAHCISEWGHNFRPDYLKLPTYKNQFNIQQTLLLTATATEAVINDMGKKFEIAKNNITLTGFYRRNLNLNVKGISVEDKIPYLREWLVSHIGESGIIYVTLQHTAEDVAAELSRHGIDAQAYHAGMDSDSRTYIQHQFMTGKINLIVATIAFGMGIDKSNIRYVVHYDLPKSIENYAQEIGRAGRDGQSAECLVLANKDNLNVLENFVYGDTPEQSAIDYVISEIISQGRETKGKLEIVLNSLSSQSNIKLLSLKTLLVYLELSAIIRPDYSYFAEYKFKLTCTDQDLISAFSGERQDFIKAILSSSHKAKVWYSLDFEELHRMYPSERNRVVSALDYLDEKSFIELQTKQITDVYQVLNMNFDKAELTKKMYQQFINKEASEIARINTLLAFFSSDKCLSKQMAEYFSDHRLKAPCGHCSVCLGDIAKLPERPLIKPLSEYDFNHNTMQIIDKLGEHASELMVSRFLCGLTTPIFTRLRVRNLTGYALFEQYRFQDVFEWVRQNNNR